MAHSICSKFEPLADESRNLSQAKKKITFVKVKQTHKWQSFSPQMVKSCLSKNSKNILWICLTLGKNLKSLGTDYGKSVITYLQG